MEEEGNAYITIEKEGVVLEKMRNLKQTRGRGEGRIHEEMEGGQRAVTWL